MSDKKVNPSKFYKMSTDYSYANSCKIYTDEKSEKCLMLADQILYQAIEDYTLLLAGVIHEKAYCTKKDCETFFYGSLYGMISDVEPKDMIKFCERQAEKIVLTHNVAQNADGRWYAYKIGEPGIPLSKSYKRRGDAKSKAAELNGLTYWIWNKLWQMDNYKFNPLPKGDETLGA